MTPPARILIVEDEAVTAMDIEDRLTHLGYQVVGRATSGEQALALVEEHRPELVLMDIRLQGEVDGIAAAQQVRRRWRSPVIFLTAYSEEATLQRAKLAEPHGYLLKPYNDIELRTTIEIALSKHAAEEEARRLNWLLDMLSQVNQTITRTETREELLPAICRLAVERAPFVLAWIGMFEPDTARFLPVAWASKQGNLVPEPATHETLVGPLRAGEMVVCNICPGLACLHPSLGAADRVGMSSCASLPIRVQGQVWGNLSLFAAEPGFFRDRELELIDEVAKDIAFALDKMESDERRRATVTELEELARFNAEILDALTTNLCVIDEQGAILAVNRLWNRCWSEPPSTAAKAAATVGANFLAICDAGAASGAAVARTLADGVRRVLRGESDEFCCEFESPTLTERRAFEVQISRFRRPGPVRVVISQTNITHRRLMEQALRDSEEGYRSLFESEPDAVLVADCETSRILEANPAAVALYGYSREELLQLGAHDLSAQPTASLASIAAGEKKVSLRWHRRKDGTMFPVELSREYFERNGRRTHVTAIRDITERWRSQQAQEESNTLLRDLHRRLIDAQENERRRLSRELHDEIGQALTALRVNLQLIVGDPLDAAERVDESLGIVDQTLQRVRGMSIDLRPSMLDDLGVVAALRSYVKRFAQRTGLDGSFRADPGDLRATAEIETACFRVAQEALTNVARHAQAHSFQIHMQQRDDSLELTVRDDGVGFDPAQAVARARRGESLGLIGMRERVELAGGTITIHSFPGSGTEVRLVFSLPTIGV